LSQNLCIKIIAEDEEEGRKRRERDSFCHFAAEKVKLSAEILPRGNFSSHNPSLSNVEN